MYDSTRFARATEQKNSNLLQAILGSIRPLKVTYTILPHPDQSNWCRPTCSCKVIWTRPSTLSSIVFNCPVSRRCFSSAVNMNHTDTTVRNALVAKVYAQSKKIFWISAVQTRLWVNTFNDLQDSFRWWCTEANDSVEHVINIVLLPAMNQRVIKLQSVCDRRRWFDRCYQHYLQRIVAERLPHADASHAPQRNKLSKWRWYQHDNHLEFGSEQQIKGQVGVLVERFLTTRCVQVSLHNYIRTKNWTVCLPVVADVLKCSGNSPHRWKNSSRQESNKHNGSSRDNLFVQLLGVWGEGGFGR